MREPLLLPMIAVAAGILTGRLLGFSINEAALPALAFAALSVAPVSTWLRRTTAALAMFFAGAFLWAWHLPGPQPWIDAEPREVVTVDGCVVEPAVFSDDRARFTLELEPGARALVEAPPESPRLAYGQRVELEARVRSPHNFGNPGAFDYAAYLARRDVFWTALVPAKGIVRLLPGRCGSRFLGWVYALRTAALDQIDRLYPTDRYASAMLEAVLIGESGHLERVWTEDFRRSGTYHALVISGLHIAVLAGVLLFLLRFVPVRPEAALVLTAAAAWLYALVSGFSTPVVRAAAGFTLYAIARMLFRKVRPLNLLAAVVLGLLAWDPAQLFEASFQLSFLSVAAIGSLAAPLIESRTAPFSRGLRGITNTEIDPHLEPRTAQFRVELRLSAETLALWTRVPVAMAAHALAGVARAWFFFLDLGIVSAAIQVALAVPMAVYFHRISLSGLTANLAIVPLMNMVVPLGFTALFTGWEWTARLTHRLLAWSAQVAAWHADLEPAWRVPDPPLWLAIGMSAALVGAALLIRRGVQRGLAVAVVMALVALLIWSPWPSKLEPGLLELTAIDVGQGDSLLVVFPQGATMLVDGGGRLEYGNRRRSNLDTGEDVVSPYLWGRGIQRIDILVATHAHQDHTGGLTALLENFRPRELWTGANPPKALVEKAQRFGVRVREQRAAAPFDLSGASVQVLAPTAGYAATRAGKEPGNNDSLAFRISFGSRSFLLTGDLESPSERRLLEDGTLSATDVLKVAHHGSRTSTTQAFLEAVRPSIAVISAGFENSFNHPHPEIVQRLDARHVTLLRTDLNGLATVRTDGIRLFFALTSWEKER
jgi:competence protein ComEC